MEVPMRLRMIATSTLVLGLSGSVVSAFAGNLASNDGAQIYMQARCFACHGELGFGGAGPRFREDRFLGLTDYVIGQILIGRDIMPAFSDALDNQQIAAVASYIRNSWGNDFGKVEPQQVAAIRKDLRYPPTPPRSEPTAPSKPNPK